ncbi:MULTISPECIES: LLM class flavin-dependent oxidoreductase [Bacillus]|uniref:LLM class flavin-dependent oxidoreductase n=1 Tax=Bacillus TaxID=1386 RepID=UPI002E1B2AD3|nr:LLM class flavin-dependent oxidoreductase [Bacillus smithii]
MSYQLGLLDQSPILEGSSAVDALQQTVRLAQKAEEWGYSRFWVSEHHHSEQVAGSSPEVLMSYLLARTKSIRIGSGGVMLQHYSPFKVAENFHVLSTLAPGRVDLGIGKAPGGLPLSTKALQFGTVNDGQDFEERFLFLKKLIENSVDEDHPLAGIEATPIPPEKPNLFLLGASPRSAQLAADLQVPFVFALFINGDVKALEESAHVYRNGYQDGRFLLSLAAVAADSQKEAEELAKDQKMYKVHLQSGRIVTVSTLEQAHAFGKQAEQSYEVEEQASYIIAGTSVYVKKVLNKFHASYQVDEFILHSPVQKVEERVRSFQLLSPNGSNDNSLTEEEGETYVS